jgi:hypothetical protein
MNRQHKFKAWDGKTMHAPFTLLEGINDKKLWWAGDYEENTIFLEFTGLYDQNKNEIYEGDIIKYPNGKYGVVQWMSEEDGFDTTGWVTSYNNYNCTGNGNVVVGNIYENSDLLK